MSARIATMPEAEVQKQAGSEEAVQAVEEEEVGALEVILEDVVRAGVGMEVVAVFAPGEKAVN